MSDRPSDNIYDSPVNDMYTRPSFSRLTNSKLSRPTNRTNARCTNISNGRLTNISSGRPINHLYGRPTVLYGRSVYVSRTVYHQYEWQTSLSCVLQTCWRWAGCTGQSRQGGRWGRRHEHHWHWKGLAHLLFMACPARHDDQHAAGIWFCWRSDGSKKQKCCGRHMGWRTDVNVIGVDVIQSRPVWDHDQAPSLLTFTHSCPLLWDPKSSHTVCLIFWILDQYIVSAIGNLPMKLCRIDLHIYTM